MKSGGLSLSAVARYVGRTESSISRVLKLHNDTNSFHSMKKAGSLRKTSPRENRMIQRLLFCDRFDTTEISRQISINLGKKVPRYIVSLRLNQVGLKPLTSHQASYQQKIKFFDLYACYVDGWQRVQSKF